MPASKDIGERTVPTEVATKKNDQQIESAGRRRKKDEKIIRLSGDYAILLPKLNFDYKFFITYLIYSYKNFILAGRDSNGYHPEQRFERKIVQKFEPSLGLVL